MKKFIIFTQKYRIHLLCILTIICFIIALKQFNYFTNTRPAYYLNKNTHKILKTRIKNKPIEMESAIQTYIREYLAGSIDYNTKIPFTSDTILLSISHDQNHSVLILNWNAYFYKALEQENIDEEIELLLKSIKKNFSINKVFFLVEGSKITWNWKGKNLNDAIDLSVI